MSETKIDERGADKRERSATLTLTLDDLKQLIPIATIGGTVVLEVPWADEAADD